MAIPALDSNVKDWVQAASWIAAVLAGLFGVWKIVVELRAAREQRFQELRWRKAKAAKELNDEMLTDARSRAAMRMLDWDGRDFEVEPDVVHTIREVEMLASMRTVNTEFSKKEIFVRDAFDKLFYFFGIFEHDIRADWLTSSILSIRLNITSNCSRRIVSCSTSTSQHTDSCGDERFFCGSPIGGMRVLPKESLRLTGYLRRPALPAA